jgi:hypothetical protein
MTVKSIDNPVDTLTRNRDRMSLCAVAMTILFFC